MYNSLQTNHMGHAILYNNSPFNECYSLFSLISTTACYVDTQTVETRVHQENAVTASQRCHRSVHTKYIYIHEEKTSI